MQIRRRLTIFLDYYADNTSVITNLVDGLLENDSYGNLTPALAEDWSVSADGLTYTYKLRKRRQVVLLMEKVRSVKAQDFVTGIKYATDNKGQAMDLIQNSIKGVEWLCDRRDQWLHNSWCESLGWLYGWVHFDSTRAILELKDNQ